MAINIVFESPKLKTLSWMSWVYINVKSNKNYFYKETMCIYIYLLVLNDEKIPLPFLLLPLSTQNMLTFYFTTFYVFKTNANEFEIGRVELCVALLLFQTFNSSYRAFSLYLMDHRWLEHVILSIKNVFESGWSIFCKKKYSVDLK